MPAATATTAGSAPSAAASSTTVEPSSTAGSPPSAEVSVALPLVLCPDVHGVGSPSGATLPSTILESVPSTVVHQLAVYTTQQDVLQVLGPTGWECSASESYDGKTSVDIYPKGSADPAKGSFATFLGRGCHRFSDLEDVLEPRIDPGKPPFPCGEAPVRSPGSVEGRLLVCRTRRTKTSCLSPATRWGFSIRFALLGDGNPSGGAFRGRWCLMVFQDVGWTQTCD